MVFGMIGSLASIAAFTSFLLIKSEKTIVFRVIIGILSSLIAMLIVSSILRRRGKKRKISIFISHSNKDNTFVNRLIESLEENSIFTSTDEKALSVGDNLANKLERIMTNCDYIIFVISKNFTESEWVRREIDMAVELKKRILPIVIDDLNEKEIPHFLRDLVYADFREDYENGFDFLLRSIKKT
jgi:hypothetical protein